MKPPTHCPGLITDPPGADIAPQCQDCTKRTAPWREPRIQIVLPPDSAWDGTCNNKTTSTP